MGKALAAIGCALWIGLGCTDDTQAGRESGEPVEKKIDAAKGGTLSSAGIKVKVPADALGEDVTLSAQIVTKEGLPNAESIGSAVFDLGPDGTTFEKPVTLAIDFDPKRIPDEMQAVIAYLDGDEWQVLDDSMVKDNTVVATTTHFTPFAVIFIAGGQSAGECRNEAFKACGGDLIGTWEFSLGCVTLPADLFSSGPFAMCDGLIVNAQIDLGGTVSFGEDGSFDLEQTSNTEITLTIPKSCVPEEDCDSLAPPEDAGVSAGITVSEQGDNCVQVQSTNSENVQHGTYEVDGNSFTTMSDDGQAGDPSEYCVDDDDIRSKVVTSSGQTLIFHATRKP